MFATKRRFRRDATFGASARQGIISKSSTSPPRNRFCNEPAACQQSAQSSAPSRNPFSSGATYDSSSTEVQSQINNLVVDAIEILRGVENLLDSLCHVVGAHRGNYGIRIKIFYALGAAGQSLESVLQEALQGPAVVGQSTAASAAEILGEIENAAYFRRDGEDSDSEMAFLDSPEFLRILNAVKQGLGKVLRNSDAIIDFSLKEGHPFYPVFWQFQFFFEANGNAFVLIGSASD